MRKKRSKKEVSARIYLSGRATLMQRAACLAECSDQVSVVTTKRLIRKYEHPPLAITSYVFQGKRDVAVCLRELFTWVVIRAGRKKRRAMTYCLEVP
jgi:hypothetical protein